MQVLQYSCSARPRGSLPAFAWGDVATPIRPITGRHSLSPRSCAHTSTVVPYGSIARHNRAEVWGFRVPRNEYANDVGSVYPPAGILDRVLPYIKESTCLLTFWYKPVSSFGLFDMTMFIDSSPGLTISFLPLPLSACYWQTQRSLTGSPTVSCGYVSSSFTQENYSSCMCWWAQLTVQLVP